MYLNLNTRNETDMSDKIWVWPNEKDSNWPSKISREIQLHPNISELLTFFMWDRKEVIDLRISKRTINLRKLKSYKYFLDIWNRIFIIEILMQNIIVLILCVSFVQNSLQPKNDSPSLADDLCANEVALVRRGHRKGANTPVNTL